jgi:hypothetical protein
MAAYVTQPRRRPSNPTTPGDAPERQAWGLWTIENFHTYGAPHQAERRQHDTAPEMDGRRGISWAGARRGSIVFARSETERPWGQPWLGDISSRHGR